MSTSVTVRIAGTVQGVSFRAHCRDEADRLGITGWVRNEPDGAVAAHFEGDADGVDAMVDWCRSGPSGAEVEAVDVEEASPSGDASFEVRD